MDRLASEDHSHIATEEEIDVYRGNWWICSNLVNFDTMPTRRQLDFKNVLSILHRLKRTEDKAHSEKLVAKFLLMVAMANYMVASLLWDFTTKMDWTLIERRNLCTQWIIYLFVAWISQRIWCTIYTDYIGYSQRSSLSPTVGVKSTSPITENWLRKLCTYSLYNNTSNEDKHDTNFINYEYNDTNTDTRKLHNTVSTRWERVVFVVTPWCVTCTSWLKVLLSLMSSA